jgi:malate/lactate dehydrogenase
MSERKVMVIGLGRIGNYALEFLARTLGIGTIYAADIDKEVGLAKTNNALLGAAQMGYYPNVEFIPLDIYNIEETASILNKIAPDVILSCVTLQAWWVISELPQDLYRKLRVVAGFGPWLPMHLTPNYKLMKAIKNAGIKTHVVVAAFPDATCPVLGKVGLAPTIGLGNLDNFIPEIQKVVGERFGIPMRNVSVYMIGAHVLRTAFKLGMENVPYYLKIFAGDKDVTKEFNAKQLLIDAANLAVKWQSDSKVASSGAKNVLAILNNTRDLTHSPGPQGLPGGYPVRLSLKGAEVALPEGVTMKEAIRINEEGNKLDGIEKIENDGTVVYTENAVNVMKEIFGYDCRRIKIDENEEKARELGSRYKEFAKKFEK